ncbi:MAG: KH domain-containing protein [Armatimonadetes bacterium]|nr:KH domain-containing protein [Armatimonadota bacterium]
MRDLVEYLVKELVAHPDAVVVEEVGDRQGTIYEVHVDPADVGKVIGKGGKVANSLRTLTKAAASKHYGRASVEVVTD